jgi:CRISPR-associated exonuclease Cas4
MVSYSRWTTNWQNKLQLAAYALLLEEAELVQVNRGYIYLIPKRRLVKVDMTSELRAQVEATMAAMQHMVEQEQMPEPATNRNYCAACEFRRFCNDV